MPRSRLDHIVVTAASLQEGIDYVRDALGVEMQAGGEHEHMGTHNCLLKLGDKLFLEVIAANPAPRIRAGRAGSSSTSRTRSARLASRPGWRAATTSMLSHRHPWGRSKR